MFTADNASKSLKWCFYVHEKLLSLIMPLAEIVAHFKVRAIVCFRAQRPRFSWRTLVLKKVAKHCSSLCFPCDDVAIGNCSEKIFKYFFVSLSDDGLKLFLIENLTSDKQSCLNTRCGDCFLGRLKTSQTVCLAS